MTAADVGGGAAGWHATADLETEPRDRVAGRLRYVIDTELPGMAFGAIVRSPVPAGRLSAIETAEAERLPGVLRVVSAADLEAAGLASSRFGALDEQPILPTERVTYVGEPVAIVIAETAAAARRGAALARVVAIREPAVLTPEDALAVGAPVVREGRPDNVLTRWARSHGDLRAARNGSTRIFHGRFSTPAAQQASLEPHVCLAAWHEGRLEVWSTSQSPSRATEDLAKLFGIQREAVAVRVPPLGGGYGGKNQTKLEPLVAFAARVAGRPVKVVNDRADEFVTVTKHAASVEIESGVDGDGRFTFRAATIRWNAGAYAFSSAAVARAGGLAVLGPYRVPAASVESVMAWTNLPPAGSFRGLGVSQASWAGEQQVDEIARAIGANPTEFRRANLVRSGERLWTGERVADAHWIECLDAAVTRLEAARAGRSEAVAEPRPSAASGARRVGTGIAVAMKHTITPSRSEAEVAVRPDGRIEVRTSAVDMGQGVEVVLARIAAEALDLPLDRIVVLRPDTARTPYDMTTSSSRATFAVGSAVEAACHDLVDRVIEAASVVLDVPPERLRWTTDGVREAPDRRHLSLGDLAGRDDAVGRAAFVNEPERDAETGEPVSSSHWHQGAVALQASVDVETGVVRVEAIAGAAWAGRVVNKPGARLQNEGNLIFGLGPTLMEALDFRAGAPAATDLLDYRLPTIRDVPWALETVALENAREPEVGGHRERHGLGESLIPAVAPAVANAVADATDVRVRHLPLSPERVLAALDDE